MQRVLWAAIAALCLAGAAPADAADPLVLQLKWLPDAQFAGYYVAAAKGFYRDAGLDVTIKPGGPDINPSQVLAARGADVAVDWLASALVARDRGVPEVNIAQIFQHSGMQLTCRRDSGVRRPADLKGKTLGVWFAGNEYPFLAWMAKLGLKTGGATPDVTILRQGAGVELLVEGRAACISTMSYNEYWQVIDAGLKPSQLVVFRYDDEGVATLEDGLYALPATIADPVTLDRLARFVRASVAGWRYAAAPAHQAEAVGIVVQHSAGEAADPRQAARMLREVAKLVANREHGLGYLEPAAYERTVKVLLSAANPVIRNKPDGAWTRAIWDRAFAR
ncbi:MAG TPA: ABC transporter substrate-binding protein [Stellaceae bacterium]|nr:ABC transporter substrate-binding protein [Stellaceae bacterium]